MTAHEISMFGEAERELERIVERFEKAIAAGEEARIEDFLPEDADARQKLLVELVHVDLELGIKRGRPQRVEAYVARFPELTEAQVRELLIAEFRLRRARDPALSAKAFLADYPQFDQALADTLNSLVLETPKPPTPRQVRSADQLTLADRRHVMQIVERFAQSWGQPDRRVIEDLLPDAGPLRLAVLAALVQADLETRLAKGLSARVEEYLRRFPELEQNASVLKDLIQTEFNLRMQSEPDLLPNEYRVRFPGMSGPKLPERGLSTRCPHCHCPIELGEQSSLQEIICPSCGSAFNLITAETTATYGLRTNRIAQFELLERLGMGAFGTVWKARDTKLNRIVAVKIPRRDQFDDADAAKFFREAQAAAQLRHPHIVSVHEIGREEEFVYIVSDFVDGANLREWLTGRRLTMREAAELCVTLAEALQHAHNQKVIHRDLKPSNIMMDLDRRPHIMDFGLAKRETAEITMTVDGATLGTPAYMSPEQAEGKAHQADGTTDIYSLGVILFELLTGELPFRGAASAIIVQKRTEEPPSPRKFDIHIPRDLETICLKCLEREPSRRIPTAQQLAEELRHWLNDEPITIRPVSRAERTWRWCRRNPTLALLTGSVALLLLALTTVAWASERDMAKKNQELDKQRNAAEAAKSDAESNRQRAVIDAEIARIAQRAADNERERAQKERERAEKNLALAGGAVDTFFTKISESQLLNMAGTQQLRRELLQDAKTYYEQFAAQHQGDAKLSPTIRADLAAAHFRVAQTIVDGENLGIVAVTQVLFAVGAGLSILEELLKDRVDPENWGSIREGIYKGRLRFKAGAEGTRLPPPVAGLALSTAQRACRIWEDLERLNPGASGIRNDLAGMYNIRGLVQDSAGMDQEAIDSYQQAIAIWTELLEVDSRNPNYQSDLAIAYANQSEVYRAWGNARDDLNSRQHLTKAIELQKRTLEIQERLIRSNPSPNFVVDLTGTRRTIGILYEDLGDFTEAMNYYRQAEAGLPTHLAAPAEYDDQRNENRKRIALLEEKMESDSESPPSPQTSDGN